MITSIMQKNNNKAMMKNGCKTEVKISKIFVRINKKTNLKLSELGYMGEIQHDLIRKLVDHAHVCDKWWLERDEEYHD